MKKLFIYLSILIIFITARQSCFAAVQGDNMPARNTQSVIVNNVPQGLNPLKLEYNTEGLNTSLADPEGNKVAYEYDTEGKVIESTAQDANGNVVYTTRYAYDEAGRVRSLSTKDAEGRVLADYSYAFDEMGNCVMEKDNMNGNYRGVSFNQSNQLAGERYYDSTDKLIKEITHNNDVAGNQVQKAVTEQGKTNTTNYEYNVQNQITKVDGKQTYKYDKTGNIITDGSKTNVYDKKGQLVKVKQGDKAIVSYQYNDTGLRTKKDTEKESSTYNYSGDQLVWVGDRDNKLKYYFTRDANGKLVNMIDYTAKSPDTYWYMLDGFGSVNALIDNSGTKVVSYSYDVWGNIIEAKGDNNKLKEANPFKFAGYQYDTETCYYYLDARYYEPSTGRFITKDSYTEHADTPAGRNLYLYAGGNPVKYYDPNGHAYLQVGTSGSDVVTLQCKLEMTNDATGKPYFTLPQGADYGYFGELTRTAVKKFQSDKGLFSDGIVGTGDDIGETWKALGLSKGEFILARGSKDINVVLLQQRLQALDCFKGTINGIFDTFTESAINEYKDKVGLWNFGAYRGKVGRTTWDYISNALQRIYNREAAVAYATNPQYNDGDEQTKEYNPVYERFDTVGSFIGSMGRESGDCANFVSQCLVAGEFKMNDEWHYYKKVVTSYVSVGIFPYAQIVPIDVTTHDMTGAWAGADAQYRYFSNPANGYANGAPIKIDSSSQISSIAYNSGVQKGDLLYWDFDGDGVIEHATIISKVESGDMFYSGHTKDRNNYSLIKGIDDTKQVPGRENCKVYIVKILKGVLP